MKRKRYLLIGLALGVMIGWVLGFLRVPYLEKNASFLLGFIAALASISLTIMLLALRDKGFALGPIGPKTEIGDVQNTRRHTFIWVLLVGAPVLGGIVSGLTFYVQNTSLKLQIQKKDERLQEMSAMVQAANKNNLAPLMRTLLEDVGEELKLNPGRTLCDSTIARISALSFSFKPYRYFEHDSLSDKAYSPERGQLLQALALLPIDSSTFARIKQNTLFAGADLRQTDFKGLDLSGINLKAANLKEADWSGANLREADLGEANLWGTKLNKANLGNADLTRADLRWAQLNEATLTSTHLNGANLANAQLRKSDLKDAIFEWAQSGGALFDGANLTSAHFTGTNLTKANLSQTDLSGADLRKINLSEAVLVGARLNNVLVDENWPAKLMEWKPLGIKELQKNYTVANDTFDKGNRPLYRLKKNGR